MPPLSLGNGLGLSRVPRPFSPLDLAPALWLRSDLGITLNGGNVSAWADQSGNGRHFNQVTAGAQPIYTSSGGAGSAPYLELGGTRYLDSALAASAWTWMHTGGADVYAVLRTKDADPNAITGILATAATTANGVVFGCEDRAALPANNRVSIGAYRADGAEGLAYTTSADGGLPAQTWSVVQWSLSTVEARIRVAGASVANWPPTNLASGAATHAAKIGRLPPAFTLGSPHYISEIIAFSRATTANLTALERARLTSYLAGRYALVG